MINNLTVAMITLNEQENLARILPHLCKHCAEIVVVDSFSSDNTVNILDQYNIKYIQNEFIGFGYQWNTLLNSGLVTNNWILKVDPDEELSERLWSEIDRAVSVENTFSAYQFRRALYIASQPTPAYGWVVRLFRNDRSIRFSQVLVNEHPIITGRIGRLKGWMNHFDVDLNKWLIKQNNYSSLEAKIRVERHSLSSSPKIFGNSLERRMFLKKHYSSLPFRFFILKLFYIIRYYRFKNLKGLLMWVECRIFVMRLREYKVRELIASKMEA